MDSDLSLSGLGEVISDQLLIEKERKILANDDGGIARSYCEIIFAMKMKEAIRAGQIHLPQSRKNISFLSMIYDAQAWKKDRERLCIELSLSPSPTETLGALSRQYNEAITAFVNGLPDNRHAVF